MDAGSEPGGEGQRQQVPPRVAVEPLRSSAPRNRLTVTQSRHGRAGRRARGTTAERAPRGRSLHVDRGRVLHEAARRRRRRGDQGRVARAAIRCADGRPPARRSRPRATGRSSTSSTRRSRASSSRPRARTISQPLHALLASADAVVWSRGSPVAEHAPLAPPRSFARIPHLTVTSITPFGLEGPWTRQGRHRVHAAGVVGRDRRARARADPTVRRCSSAARSGSGSPASSPRSGPWRRVGGNDSEGELVDVSMLEALAMCLTYYPVTFHDQLGRPMRRRRFVPTPGVGAASDGLVGLGCGTGQQWLDFCVMVEHPEWMEDPKLFLDRTALAPTIDAWIADAHRRRGARLWRRPSGSPTHRSPTAPTSRRSSTSVRGGRSSPTRGTAPPIPRPPFRLGAAPAPAARAGAPARRALDRRRLLRRERTRPRPDDRLRRSALPFEGLRVLDMTAYWAGPLAGHVLALLGAEVIHLESPTRPDGARLVGGVPQTEDRFWERGPIFAALNTNKKSLTIDLGDPARHRSRAPLRRDVRRGRRELHAASAGPARSRLRDAAGRSTRSRHAADAGFRARRAVARAVGLRVRDRGRFGAHLAHGASGSAPVRAVLRR